MKCGPVYKQLFKIVLLITFSAALLAPACEAVLPEAEGEAPPDHMKGQLLVQFKPQAFSVSETITVQGVVEESFVFAESIDAINRRLGVYEIRPVARRKKPKEDKLRIHAVPSETHDIYNVFKVSFPRELSVEEAIEEYLRDPNVEAVELNAILHVDINPNDPWFLDKTQWGPWKISLTELGSSDSGWNYSRGNKDVIIAVIDTGADYNHPDLRTNIWVNPAEDYNGNGIADFFCTTEGGDLTGRDDSGSGYIDDLIGWDFVSVSSDEVAPGEDYGPPDNDPMDFHGHGSHCSGIASAVTDNSIGIAGVGWNCSIMVLRAGWARKWGGASLLRSDVLEAIYYAANNGADIISMSFGSSMGSTFEVAALNYAYDNGLFLVASAGNAGRSESFCKFVQYPAGYSNVVAVVATGPDDIKTDFSTYGTWTDVCAPGLSILSTFPDNKYASWSGTSMAAPHVAGLAGLIKARFPEYSPAQIKSRILSSCDDIFDINHAVSITPDNGIYHFELLPGELGAGRINAFKALSGPEEQAPIILRDRKTGNAGYTDSTTVSVEVIVTGDTPDQMMVSTFENFAGASWTAFSQKFTFELDPGDGVKTVYFKAKRGITELPTESAQITLDTTPPEAVSIVLKDVTSGHTHLTNEREVSVEVSADDANSVILMMISEDPLFAGVSWEAYRTKTQFTLSEGSGTKEVFFKAADPAGNTSSAVSEKIEYNPYWPELSGIILRDRTSGSEMFTNEMTIEVEALDVVGSFEALLIRMSESPEFEGAPFQKYVNPTTFEITTAGGNFATKEVFYYLTDSERGYTSEVYSNTIILDNVMPAVTARVPAANATNVSVFNMIRITFNDEMITESVTVSAYPYIDMGQGAWTAVAGVRNRRVTFDNFTNMRSAHAFAATYTITVEGLDKAENPLSPHTWKFTTEPPSTVEGYVTRNSMPLPGVYVEAARITDTTGQLTMFLGSAETDAAGFYRISNIPGTDIEVEPIAPGLEIRTAARTLGMGETLTGVDIDLSREAWPAYRGSRLRGGYTPYGSIEAENLKLKWSFCSGVHAGGTNTSPSAAYGNVYTALGGKIFCLDGDTGELKWSAPWTSEMAGSPTIANNIVFLLSRWGDLHAYNAHTGGLLWSQTIPGFTAQYNSPTFANGIIYTMTSSNRIISVFNAYSGRLIWRSYDWTANTIAPPVIMGHGAYFNCERHGMFLSKFAREKESLKWSFPADPFYEYYPGPAASKYGIISTNLNNVISANASDGSLNWSYSVPDEIRVSPIVRDGKVYFFGIRTGQPAILYVIDEEDGSFISRGEDLGIEYMIHSAPAYVNGTIYFGSVSYLIGVDAETGSEKTRIYAVGVGNSSPAVCENTIYLSSDRRLFAFSEGLPPHEPLSLEQLHPVTGMTIEAGSTIEYPAVLFRIKMKDPDLYGSLMPEIELIPTSEAFSGVPNVFGQEVPHSTEEVFALVESRLLENNTDYRWQVRVKDEAGETSGWIAFNTGDKAFGLIDKISPEVLSTSPAPGEPDVSVLSPIRIFFSEPVDMESLVPSFLISPSTAGTFEVPDPISGEVVFCPNGHLLGGTLYTVTVEGGVTDIAGNPMGQDHTFAFMTGAAGAASGHVRLEGFGGIPRARVDFSKDGVTRLSTTTDDLGHFSSGRIPADTYTVQAVKPGYSLKPRYEVSIPDGSETILNFDLARAWPMSMLDAKNTKTLDEPGFDPPLSLKWSFFVGEPESEAGSNAIHTSPVIDGGIAYFGSDRIELYAVDLADGSLLWSNKLSNYLPYHEPGESYMESSPVVMNDSVFATVTDPNWYAHLFEIDKFTGTLIWSMEIAGMFYPGFAVDSGRLYTGIGDKILCIDAGTKTMRWSYRTDGWILSTPAVHNNTVFFGVRSFLFALNTADGALKWSLNMGPFYGTKSSPIIHDGTLYIGHDNKRFFAVEPETGTMIWSYNAGREIYASPLGRGDRIFAADKNDLLAISKDSGERIWTARYWDNDVHASPILVNDIIYIKDRGSASSRITAVSPDSGAMLWSMDLPRSDLSEMAVSQGVLLIAGEDGVMRALSPAGYGDDTSPPVITFGPEAKNITTNEAVITWKTDELSNSIVEYGLTKSYGNTADSAVFTLDHAITLEGLTDNKTYNARAGGKDIYGNGPAWSEGFTFTTAAVPGKDYSYPEISVFVDGARIINGDIIKPLPSITATITDNATVDVSSIRILINDHDVPAFEITTLEAPSSYRVSYDHAVPLEPENVRKHNIRIDAADEAGNLTIWEARDLRVVSGPVKIEGVPLSYPAVFKPLTGEKVNIAYTLTGDAGITFYLYDISGRIALTKKFAPGSRGGRAGYNSFEWDGTTDFGHTVGNGIYVYKIISGNRVLGTGKLVVYD